MALRPQNFKEQVYFTKFRKSIDGNDNLEYGLTNIKGIGQRFAQAVVKTANMDPNERIGALSENEIELLEDIITNPVDHGIPSWMVNRRKDIRTGEDKHVLGNELEITVKRDIDRMKRIKCYKGIRHQLGLKVRGQRTKSTGRHGLVIGVQRKKLRQQMEAKKKKKKKKKKKEDK